MWCIPLFEQRNTAEIVITSNTAPYGTPSSSSSETNLPKVGKGKKSRPRQQPFYVEDKNNIGVVFKKYPKQKSVRKAVPEPIFPQVEERISTKEVHQLGNLRCNGVAITCNGFLLVA